MVGNLSSIHLEKQTKAMEKIRMLSKETPENRVLVVEHEGIPPLVQLLCYTNSKIQEHKVKTLLNLSIDEGNKSLISTKGAIPTIIEVLENGSCVAKERKEHKRMESNRGFRRMERNGEERKWETKS